MALFDSVFYCNYGDGSTTGYYAVTKRPQNTAVAAGVLRRQFTAPAVNSERVFVCIVAGTTANTTDATWILTRGALTVDGTATWQECTGASAVNGDATNTPTWGSISGGGSAAITLGQIIKRNNGASYWICSTAGNTAAGGVEPVWPNDTAGSTRTDSTVTWTCLGVVGNFTGGGAPHARLLNAWTSTWGAAGNTIYLGDNHAETQATNISISFPALGGGAISKTICHNHSGSYPPASGDITTGATVSTTGTGTGITLTGPSFYVYGVTFKGGSGASGSGAFITLTASSPGNQTTSYYENCSFQVGVTSASGCYITITAGYITWKNCTVKFGNAAHFLNVLASAFIWQNTGQILASGSSVPTTLMDCLTWTTENVLFEALDLSQLTGAIFSNNNASQPPIGNYVIKDCKLNASGTIQQPLNSGTTVQLVRSDSAATAYKSARYQYEGTETTEASVTRSGGAVDPTGQAQSRKIVSTANSQWLRPFKAEPYAIWNPTTGSNVTVTVYGTINSASLPNNDDIWLEIEYLGSSTFPVGTIVNTSKAQLWSANAAVASDSSSWNGGGSGAGWSPFKLVATLSSPQPGMAGYLEARVMVGKASTTYYLDPMPVLS